MTYKSRYVCMCVSVYNYEIFYDCNKWRYNSICMNHAHDFNKYKI